MKQIEYKNGMVLGLFVSAFGALLFVPASIVHEYAVFLAALFILAIGVVALGVLLANGQNYTLSHGFIYKDDTVKLHYNTDFCWLHPLKWPLNFHL